MYLAFDNDLRAVVGAIEVRLVVRFECEVLKSVMLICDEKGHVSLARALTPKGGRFYTAGVSYFQYRVPTARSNLCRTPELYITGTAMPNQIKQ